MEMVKKIVEFYLLSLGLGVGIFSPLASSKLTGHGFLKVIHSICLVALFIALAVHFSRVGLFVIPNYIYAMGLFSFALVISLHRDQKSFFMWLLYIFQNVSLIYLLFLFVDKNISQFFFYLSSSLFLGVVTYAMILGHWYLVVFKLTEKPLLYATYFLWGILAFKILWSFIILIKQWDYFSIPDNFTGDFSFIWMVICMRFVWGYFIMGIMSYYSWRLIKMRSIQSATGVLYVMTFFVFVGELISNFLQYKYGIMV